MTRKLMFLVVLGSIGLWLAVPACAQGRDKEEKVKKNDAAETFDETTEPGDEESSMPEDGSFAGIDPKTVEGTVSGIGKDFIVITYAVEEKEGRTEEFDIHIPLDPEVQVAHKKDMNEIGVGDTVSVEYEEEIENYVEEKPDGTVERGTRPAKRMAKKVTFLRPAVNDTGVLRSN